MNECNEKNEVKTNKLLVALIVIGCVLTITIGVLGVYFIGDKLGISLGRSRVELQHTDVSTVKSDGIYITDVSDVVGNVMPSIVSITSKTLVSSGRFGPSFWGSEQYAEGAGSGIIIGKNDEELLILTNNHVVADTSELSVQFINEKSADATIKGASSTRDVAVIAVKLDDLDKKTLEAIKITTMGDSDELKVGNGVIAIGNALGYGQSVTTGVVSAVNREVVIDGTSNKMIQIDAAINGGNSGGALLNSKGEVVGINSAKYSSNRTGEASIEGMGFAIPISDVEDLINDLMNGKSVKEESEGVLLGITGGMISNPTTGFYISSVEDNSNAMKANLRVGDIITKIDGKDVKSIDTISNVLKKCKEGDKITLMIVYENGRTYTEREVKVTLN